MFHVEMTNKAYRKMAYFVDECDEEISGFGKCRPEKFIVNGEEVSGLLVYDVEILRQTVSGTHSTIDEEVLVQFLTEKTANSESTKDYKVWWHSHVNMAAFFSGTDTNTMETSTGFPYLLSIVTNKREEVLARLDIFGDLPQRDVKVNLHIQPSEDKKLRKFVRDEIANKVTFSNFTYKPTPIISTIKEDEDELLEADKKENTKFIEEIIEPASESWAWWKKKLGGKDKKTFNQPGDTFIDGRRKDSFDDDDEEALLQKTGGQRGW